ncbi:MAG: OmpA family protein [Polyangiaceae bacterium]
MPFNKTLLVQLCLTCALVGRPAHADGTAISPPNATPKTSAAQNAATAEAERRRVSLLEQNSTSGSTGLLHLTRPGSGAAGTFRVSVLFDIFSGSGFLCNSSTPCGTNTHDSADRAGTVLGLSVTPLSFLEAYASLHSAANYDNLHSPGVIDVLGNADLGLKLFSPDPLAGVFSVGGLAQVALLNGSGSVGLSGKGTSFRFAVLGDVDLRNPSGGALPLHILTNVGYLVDNSGALVQGTETSRGSRITRVERFGLGINRVDRFQTGLGVEAQLPFVRPFVEWNVEVPVNRQNYTCTSSKSASGDRCLGNFSSFSALPSTLTLGARVSPFLKGLSASAAIDLGTSGTSNFLEELTPTLPWDLWLGVGYAFDIEEPKPVPVVIVQERVAPAPAAPPALRIRGLVHEHGKETSIGNAILHYRDRDLTAMASGSDGRFISTDLEPGTYTFGIDAEGYKSGNCTVVVAAAPSPKAATAGTGPAGPAASAPSTAPSQPGASNISYTDADCTLESLPRAGNVAGQVLNVVSSNPIAGATVELTDSLHRSLSLVTDSSGSFRFEHVIPGAVTVNAASREYLFRAQTLTLAARQEATAELRLRKRPNFSRVLLTATELKISQPVHFEQDSPVIAADSESLLDEVADALGSNPRITHIEIQGHTDNSGNPEHNQSLSEARANAVLDWLASHGIDPQRMSARGYGQDRPLSPNVTPQGHARNRRIQFVISTQSP